MIWKEKRCRMNLPNKLTMVRVFCVPVFIACYMLKWFIPALIIFIAASITDMLDGKLARKFDLVTNFGKIMDPLADKILVYSAFCLMVEDGLVPTWMLIVILAREFLIAGMRTVAASSGIVIAADMSGKIKTVLQMIAVIVLLVYLALNSVFPEAGSLLRILFLTGEATLYAALVMTVVSGYSYVNNNREVFRQ